MNYDKFLSERASNLKPSGIRKFFDLASKMQGVVSLGVGEPDFITDWQIRSEAITSIQRGITQYTANAGLLQLRKEIAEFVSTRYNVSYDPQDEIIITIGASEGIDLSMRALLDYGDEVLVPEPSYVSYSPCVTLAGGKAIPITCTFENEFKVTASEMESKITSKTKAILLPYPNNPTGSILSKEELIEIANVIKKHDLLVISDEVYAELTYGDNQHTSIASIDGMKERTILLNGFSKAFAMTGWRIGFFCAPKEITQTVYKIHQYCIMCAPTMSQYAALEALRGGKEDNYQVIRSMKEQYDMRRKFLYSFFKEIGMKVFEPKGAFYIFPSTRAQGITGDVFAEKLLEKEKVAVVPGSAFGASGEYNIRISYAYSMQSLEIATQKIRKFVEREEWKE